MADDLKKQISGLWSGFRKKAADTIAGQEAAFARGKIAGRTITDDDGNVIVEAGHRIDDAVIERATAAGRLHAVTGAAANAQAQDIKEKARDAYDRTQDGQEAKSLGSVEDFVEARRYLGRVAVLDVTDIRGNVVVPGGTRIDYPQVEAARNAGLLQALIYSAQQPQPARTATPPPAPAPTLRPPTIPDQSQPRPRALPLVTPPDSIEPER